MLDPMRPPRHKSLFFFFPFPSFPFKRKYDCLQSVSLFPTFSSLSFPSIFFFCLTTDCRFSKPSHPPYSFRWCFPSFLLPTFPILVMQRALPPCLPPLSRDKMVPLPQPLVSFHVRRLCKKSRVPYFLTPHFSPF